MSIIPEEVTVYRVRCDWCGLLKPKLYPKIGSARLGGQGLNFYKVFGTPKELNICWSCLRPFRDKIADKYHPHLSELSPPKV